MSLVCLTGCCCVCWLLVCVTHWWLAACVVGLLRALSSRIATHYHHRHHHHHHHMYMYISCAHARTHVMDAPPPPPPPPSTTTWACTGARIRRPGRPHRYAMRCRTEPAAGTCTAMAGGEYWCDEWGVCVRGGSKRGSRRSMDGLGTKGGAQRGSGVCLWCHWFV